MFNHYRLNHCAKRAAPRRAPIKPLNTPGAFEVPAELFVAEGLPLVDVLEADAFAVSITSSAKADPV